MIRGFYDKQTSGSYGRKRMVELEGAIRIKGSVKTECMMAGAFL